MGISTRPRKVLFVITKSNFGGAQKYVYEMARALHQEGTYDVSVAHGGTGLMLDKLREAGVRTVELKTLRNNISFFALLSNLWEITQVIRKERPHIIHANSSKAGQFTAFCGRFFSSSKVIFTSHGWPYNEERAAPVRALLWFAMLLTVLFSHRTIAVSKKVKDQTPLLFLFRNKIDVIYFGIPRYELFERAQAREILGIEGTEDRIEIVTTAELHPNKGYAYALSAIRNLVFNENLNIHYHILGDGKDEEKIRALVKKYSLEFHVTLHGFVQDAAKYMKAFDIFLLTSTTEALGFVTLEAGNARVPVVATRVGGIPEVIEHEKTGLLADSKDTKAIKENLKRLIVDENLRKSLGDELYQSVQEKFTLEKTIEKTMAVYESGL